MSRRFALAIAAASLLAWIIPAQTLASIPGHRPPALTSLTFRPVHQSIGDLFGLGTFIARRYPDLAKPSLARVKLTGADWVREEFMASDIHRSSDAPYRFAKYDPVVDEELHRGMHVMGLLDYNNTFDGLPHTFMPHRDIGQLTTDFLAYVRKIVNHFRHRIFYWQIWNEPDLHSFWGPFPYASDYAHLLRDSYQVIKSINPQAHVLVGGPSGSDPHGFAFLHKVVADGGKFDIITGQPYTAQPNQVFVHSIQELEAFHKPLWISEMGWAGQVDCRPCGSQLTQASRLAVLYLVAAVNRVHRMFWYDFRDDGLGLTYRDHFGLVEWNLAPKPAYFAYALSLLVLNRKTITGVDQVTPWVTVWRLGSGQSAAYVALNTANRTWGNFTFKWASPKVRVLNYSGYGLGASSGGELKIWIRPRMLNYILPYRQRLPSHPLPGLNIPPGHT